MAENIFASIICNNRPMALAKITGNADNPDLSGDVNFYATPMGGIIVMSEVHGLPDRTNPSGFYGMHIHEFGDCALPFDKTGTHYNPNNTTHPNHAGDLPPLLSNNGYAWMNFFTTHLTISEILGKSIIIHNMRDDFTTQPSGDSGAKIGCGLIRPILHKLPGRPW